MSTDFVMNTNAPLRTHATSWFMRWMHVEESVSISKDWSTKNGYTPYKTELTHFGIR